MVIPERCFSDHNHLMGNNRNHGTATAPWGVILDSEFFGMAVGDVIVSAGP